MTNTENLSPEAKSALINTRTGRRGEALPSRTAPEVRAELTLAGLIGERGGLTERGGVTRTRLMNAALDAAF